MELAVERSLVPGLNRCGSLLIALQRAARRIMAFEYAITRLLSENQALLERIGKPALFIKRDVEAFDGFTARHTIQHLR